MANTQNKELRTIEDFRYSGRDLYEERVYVRIICHKLYVSTCLHYSWVDEEEKRVLYRLNFISCVDRMMEIQGRKKESSSQSQRRGVFMTL